MNIIKNMKNYILEDEFQLRLLNNRINIVNYTSIGHFDNNKVIVRYENGEILIKGEKISVTKLLDDEILIIGEFKSIELR